MSKKPYILVAEDDAVYGSIYQEKLTTEGYEVKILAKGSEVIAEIQHRKPDLLLLDLLMPIVDGFEILDKLRASKLYKDLPVIVASNLSSNINNEKVARYKLADYFIKSEVSVDDVVHRIKVTLKVV
ncbi:MAG TPA: response regulator [Candidatus Limnocylindria bacterium]|nr:response regulator [Candidatus Limnocylindria bacterium]